MATATQMRPQEKTGNWAAIFPNEQVTEQQSSLFVKKLLAVAISNITYLRAIFPEHAFGDRCLEDLNLKILRDDSTCPGACQVIKWVKGCFDALDKKYLRLLVIGIYVDPSDENTVIESYTFKFTYTDNGGVDIYRNDKKISSAYTAAETKKATIRLLRTIVVLTQTLKSLPDDVMMTMKLLYYDEDTPLDYEPPGFRTTENESFYFEEKPMNIKVGDVATPFHTVKVRIKTDGKQFDLKEDNEGETMTEEHDQEIQSEGLDEADVLEDMDIPDTSVVEKEASSPLQGPTQCEDVPLQSPAKPANEKDESLTSPADGEEEYGVKCPCGCNEDDGLMVLCCVCKLWQHGVCFMIVNEEDAPEKHFCNDCCSMDNPETLPTDPYLVGLSSIAVQATCLWRRALMACTETSRILQQTFSRRLGVEMTVAQGLMNRLEKEGFIKNPTKGKRLGKMVNKEKIFTDGVGKYFKKQKKVIGRSEEPDSKKNESTKEPAPPTMFEETNRTTNVTSSSNEIEVLAEITGDLNLNGKKKKKSKNSRPSALNKETHQVRQSPRPRGKEGIVEMAVERPEDFKQQRGKKRAISRVDTAAEFDVSNSQDVEYDNGHLRKRKASVAAKAIMV